MVDQNTTTVLTTLITILGGLLTYLSDMLPNMGRIEVIKLSPGMYDKTNGQNRHTPLDIPIPHHHVQ